MSITEARSPCSVKPAGYVPGRGARSNAVVISKEDLRERRVRFMAPVLGLFYDPPLHLVRGEGGLYDAEGRAYLDAYNNVAHVGRDRFTGRCCTDVSRMDEK